MIVVGLYMLMTMICLALFPSVRGSILEILMWLATRQLHRNSTNADNYGEAVQCFTTSSRLSSVPITLSSILAVPCATTGERFSLLTLPPEKALEHSLKAIQCCSI